MRWGREGKGVSILDARWNDDFRLAALTVTVLQVYTRPPFYVKAAVGVGPYVDWLESHPIETVYNQPPMPKDYVGAEPQP